MKTVSWMSHIDHLADGRQYSKNCSVCELRCEGSHRSFTPEVRKSLIWYHKAQQSGRKSIEIGEEL